MASIVITRFELPGQVFGGGQFQGLPIRTSQFIAEFDVTVDLNGCYAIDVRLVEDDNEIITLGLNQDEVIAAHTGARYKCYCFTARKTRRFSITTGNPPLPGEIALAPSPRAVTLTPLEGRWPNTDSGGGFEVRIEIKVVLCEPKPCQTDDECGFLAGPAVRKSDGVVDTVSDETDIELLDGPEPFEVIKPLIEKGVQAGGALMGRGSQNVTAPSALADIATPSADLLRLATDLKFAKREIRRIRRLQMASRTTPLSGGDDTPGGRGRGRGRQT